MQVRHAPQQALTAGARSFRQVKTPLQSDVDFVIRILVVLVTLLGLMLITAFLREARTLLESVQASAVIKISSGAGSAWRSTRQVDRKSATRFRVVIMTEIVSTCAPAK